MAAARLLRPLFSFRTFAAPSRHIGWTYPRQPPTRRFHIPPTRIQPRGSRLYSSRPTPGPSPNSAGANNASLSLSQRLRKLSREYGWSAVGIYLTLSVLDFPFCLLAIRLLGTERVGRWEHAAYETVRNALRVPFPTLFPEHAKVTGSEAASPEAEEADGAGVEVASMWTQLALAYAIHKSFIFVRVPLTAAITPQVVKTLRKWGWNIGKRRPKTS